MNIKSMFIFWDGGFRFDGPQATSYFLKINRVIRSELSITWIGLIRVDGPQVTSYFLDSNQVTYYHRP